MSYTFDGINKLIILSPGTTALDVKDCYSRWKEWAATGDNLKFAPFFDVVGGNSTVGQNAISSYFFLLNGVKIRPQEAHHTITVNGILYADDASDPFANTLGNWRIRVVQVTPMQAETIAVDSGGGGATPSQIANAVWSHGSALALTERVSIAQAILQNKTVTDPATGQMTVFASDGVTPLLVASLFENVAQTQAYRGQGAEVRGALA